MTGNDGFRLGTLARLLPLTLCALLLASAALEAGPADDAKAATKARRWAAAADAWAAVLEKKDGDRTAALGLADTAIRAGQPDHFQLAEDALRDLQEKNAKDADVLVALGRICLATSAAKKDTLAKKSYDDEAKRTFQSALAAAPTSDGAAAGLAQTYYQMGDFGNAVKTVDDFLASKPEKPTRALFWKGQTLYLQARDAFAAGGNKLTSEATSLFRKAQGAYQASAMVGGDEPDVWIQLAYASTYLGGADNIETASDAYRKAAAIDATDKAPFVGLKSLYTHTPDKYRKALADLLAKNPKHEWALWFHAVDRYEAQDWAKARDAFEGYAKIAATPAQGYYYAGVCAAQAGDADRAEKLYYDALQADPAHAQAAGAIQKRLMESGAEQRARGSVKGAQEVIKAFTPLMKAAPDMAWIRNNVAFMLREAYVGGARGGGEAKWRPILKASTKIYTEAAETLGEWTAEKAQSYNWQQRYAEAQIISDTGLMYQFYEATRDYDTAERYYRIALEYTDDGYKDAYDNMVRILSEQKRWQDLFELAAVCSESITTEAGSPDNATRGSAEQLMNQLLASGKAKDE